MNNYCYTITLELQLNIDTFLIVNVLHARLVTTLAEQHEGSSFDFFLYQSLMERTKDRIILGKYETSIHRMKKPFRACYESHN